jgi:hypothetical protein
MHPIHGLERRKYYKHDLGALGRIAMAAYGGAAQ